MTGAQTDRQTLNQKAIIGTSRLVKRPNSCSSNHIKRKWAKVECWTIILNRSGKNLDTCLYKAQKSKAKNKSEINTVATKRGNVHEDDFIALTISS